MAEGVREMRKTKIVCTLGPSTDREGILREMIQAGMNVARFNFSHGTHAEHKARLDALGMPYVVNPTIVRGLEEKGYLAHEVYGNTYQYYAIISEEEFRKGTLKNVISKYFNNSYLSAVSSLVQEEDISLEELKQLISEVEKAHDK